MGAEAASLLRQEPYSHEEHLLLAEALLQETSHEEILASHRSRRTDLVSSDFISALSTQVDSLLLQSPALTDVSKDELRRQTPAESKKTSPPPPVSPGATSLGPSSPGSPSTGPRQWSIRRPYGKAGENFSGFDPPPRSQTRSPPPKPQSPTLATYERNVEFVKQKQARMENAQKEKMHQESGTLAPPNITSESRKLVGERYTPPWNRKETMTRSVIRNRKVTEAVSAKKALEEAEHTFQPVINQRSRAIFRHVLDAGEPWHDRVHQRPKTRLTESDEPTFRPQISKKAQQLNRGGDVTERLYRREAKAAEPKNANKMRAVQRRMLAKELEKMEGILDTGCKVKEEDEVAALEGLVRKFSAPCEQNGTRNGTSKLAALLSKRRDVQKFAAGAVEARNFDPSSNPVGDHGESECLPAA
mmetsp:Transcript_31964/g.73706  ORF Transcript_31964/g.73706 Transcript_31964/m.73706 type:complete len:417 (+) Transcript_31964:46-1296(+)